MALLDIHLLGSSVLRTRAAEVTAFDDDLRRFISDLFETMDAAEGVGLAANQVGVAKRVAVVGIDDDRFVMVNPVLSSLEGRVRGEEGCLSLPDVSGDVTRSERLVLEALDGDGKPYRRELEGYTARAVQHEVDHLDGVMFFDHLSLVKRELLLRRWKKDNPNAGLTRKVVPKTTQQP